MGNNLYKSLVFMPPDVATYTSTYPQQVVFMKTFTNMYIPGHYFKAKNKTKTTVLYSHGNACDIGVTYEMAKLLCKKLDVNVLQYDYIGYGLAKELGEATENNCYISIEASVNYLLSIKNIEYKDIIMYGTSLGSGPSCYIAEKYKKIGGLILECPLKSCINTVLGSSIAYLGNMINMDMFPNITRIKNVKCPVIMIHGEKDTTIGVDHTHNLYNNIPTGLRYEKIIVENADHGDIIQWYGLYKFCNKLKEFIDHCIEESKRLKKVKRRRFNFNDYITPTNNDSHWSCSSLSSLL